MLVRVMLKFLPIGARKRLKFLAIGTMKGGTTKPKTPTKTMSAAIRSWRDLRFFILRYLLTIR
jgi:hypothetical protein